MMCMMRNMKRTKQQMNRVKCVGSMTRMMMKVMAQKNAAMISFRTRNMSSRHACC